MLFLLQAANAGNPAARGSGRQHETHYLRVLVGQLRHKFDDDPVHGQGLSSLCREWATGWLCLSEKREQNWIAGAVCSRGSHLQV